MNRITAVWLKRRGDYTEVLIEIAGKMKSIIKEPYDNQFSHIVESRVWDEPEKINDQS